MLDLEVQQGSQESQTRRSSKCQPIAIGRHVSNDICIAEPDVAPIHCRVSWNGSSFEVASANREGVDLNGTLVRHAAIKGGDVLRIGSADVFVRDEAQASGRRASGHAPSPVDDGPLPVLPLAPPPRRHGDMDSSVDVPLKPVTEETLAVGEGWERRVLDSAYWDKQRANAKPVAPNSDMRSPESEEYESDIPIVLSSQYRSGRVGTGPNLAARLSQRINEKRVRPGEQEALRSPVILGMLAVALGLALTAAAVYFVIGRESIEQQYNAAVAEYDAKHFTQSADLFDKFIREHSGHRLADEAQFRMWNARVLKEISAASPAWKRGLEQVEKYIEANRDRKDFHDHYSDLSGFLTQIALGSARSAGSSSQRPLLDVSSSATAMLPRYLEEGKMPAELGAQIRTAYTQAQDAIIEHERFTTRIGEIEKANSERRPMAALAARRTLLALYPAAVGDAKLSSLLKQTLDVEKSLVVREALDKPAVKREHVTGVPRPLTLALHTRSHTEEPAGTRPVFVLAKDCCYAVDHVTGEPVWRRVIGLDSPFFPMSVETATPGLLLFDTSRLALDLVDRRSGKLIWEQPLNESISGSPLVDQGQIYLATLGCHLYKIDLETGRISTRLTFSQKIASPPALAHNKERLIVAGDASLVYTLTTSPLECIRVTDVGHAAGSLVNGVLGMGSVVLLTEAGQPSGTRLRVLDTRDDENGLKSIKDETIEGQVRDAPVSYGKMLFVPSVPARISAFSVSDVPGQEPLTAASSVAIPNQETSPIFLSAGPDGQLWLAGSSLRRLQLKLNAQSFALDPAEISVGISTQPLQVVGQFLFAARRRPFATSVYFSQVDREPMVGQWRTVFGSSVIAKSAASGELICIGESGEIFSLSSAELLNGGFRQSGTATIEVPAGTRSPLRACALDGSRGGAGGIAVDCAEPKPTLWIVSQGGQIGSRIGLEHPLEASPVRLGAGLVLPLPGRLRLASSSSGLSIAEDFVAPVEGGKAAAWKQVVRLGENELLATDARGRLRRLQFRTEPMRHLAEVVTRQADRPIDAGIAVAGSRIAYADADAVLHVLDAATLEPIFTEKLSAPAVGGLWTAGSLLLVETRDHQLRGYELNGPPKLRFKMPLADAGPAGPPAMVGDRLIIAGRDGNVLSLDPSSGAVTAKINVGQPLSGGVTIVEGHTVVASIDGSLYHVESLLESKKPGT